MITQGEIQKPQNGSRSTGLAVVTGAGSGIGRAIVLELVRRGVPCALLGRTLSKLQDVARLATKSGGEAIPFVVDLCDFAALATLAHSLSSLGQNIQVLVHSAALMRFSRVEESTVEEFSALLKVNLLAPFALTRLLLPEICANKGQIVFVNSSIVHNPALGCAQYAATKHAVRGLADCLRQEVNERGVRIISVFPGRTATPLQESLCQKEGREYRAEQLLQPEDVASTVIHALSLPHTAELTEFMIRPSIKPR